MPIRYKRLSLDVILDETNKRYFSHVSSVRDLERKILPMEVQYSISFEDITVKVCAGDEMRLADAILISLCMEDDDETSYIEIISSDLMGLFISDCF